MASGELLGIDQYVPFWSFARSKSCWWSEDWRWLYDDLAAGSALSVGIGGKDSTVIWNRRTYPGGRLRRTCGSRAAVLIVTPTTLAALGTANWSPLGVQGPSGAGKV